MAVADPTYLTLQDALKKAQAKAQSEPVQDRIKQTQVFIERARKRVTKAQEDVEKAQARKRPLSTKEVFGLKKQPVRKFFPTNARIIRYGNEQLQRERQARCALPKKKSNDTR